MNIQKSLTRARDDKLKSVALQRMGSEQTHSTMSMLVAHMAALLTIVRRKAAATMFNKTKDKSRSIIVSDRMTPDNSTLALSVNTMGRIPLSHGDIALVASQTTRETLLVCLIDDDLDDGFVLMNGVVRRNLSVDTGDLVGIWPCSRLRYLERAAVLLVGGNFEYLTGSIFDIFLAPYFHEAYRPVSQGDIFTCSAEIGTAVFRVAQVDPPGYGIVAQDTKIFWDVSDPQRGYHSPEEPRQRLDTICDSLSKLLISPKKRRETWHIVREKLKGSSLGRRHPHSCSTEALVSKG